MDTQTVIALCDVLQLLVLSATLLLQVWKK